MLERQRGTLLLSGATMSLRGGPKFACMAPVKANGQNWLKVWHFLVHALWEGQKGYIYMEPDIWQVQENSNRFK